MKLQRTLENLTFELQLITEERRGDLIKQVAAENSDLLLRRVSFSFLLHSVVLLPGADQKPA
jgi:hypothetical protein